VGHFHYNHRSPQEAKGVMKREGNMTFFGYDENALRQQAGHLPQ